MITGVNGESLEELHVKASRVRELLDALPCAVFIARVTPGGAALEYLFVSASVNPLLGVDAQAVLRDGEETFRHVVPEDVERLRSSTQQVCARGGTCDTEFRVVLDGREHCLSAHITGSQLADGTGLAHGHWAAIRDPRLFVPGQLATRELFRSVFEFAPQGIGIADRDGNIKAINPAYTATFGYELADAPTLPRILELLYPDPEYRERVYHEWKAALNAHVRAHGPAVALTSRMRCKDGSYRIAEFRTAVGADGETIAIFNDITVQVEAQQARARAEEQRAWADRRLHLQSSRMPVALLMLDADDKLTIREWNPAATRVFDYTAEEALGRSALALLVPAEEHEFMLALVHGHAGANTVSVVMPTITREGRTIRCEWFNTPTFDASGGIVGMMSMVEDVSARLKAEERLLLWSSVLHHSSEGIMICDAQLRILMVNAAFQAITGYGNDEAIGQTPRLLHSGRQDRAFYEEMWAGIRETGGWRGELWNRRKNGEGYPEWLAINAVKNRAGDITHYVGIFSDVTSRHETEQRLLHLAQYDALTNLPNRVLLVDRLDQLVRVAARGRSQFAVMFIDLDRFKEVNDSLGHDAGDLLLVEAAGRIREQLRGVDTVARMGGDEFVVLVAQLREPDDAAVVARKVLKALEQPLLIAGHELTITGSIGLCIYPEDGQIAQDLLRNADAAMYQAKTSGRNAYRFYTEDLNTRARERLSMESALRRALDSREFVLHYQPQIDIRSGQIFGAEALMRWNRPSVGLIPPGQFIPLAEACGLIVPLGTWAIEEAARQAHVWAAAGMDLTVAVNLSAVQFHQKGFADEVVALIAGERMAGCRLELELTESILIRDEAATIDVLQRLHELGVSLSIDDFGTGYSSLNYLCRFPLDRLKIDKSFIDEIVQNPKVSRVVGGIISLAKALNLRVLAEGVETEEQLALLESQGCDEAQGFLFNRALTAPEFQALWRNWPAHGAAPRAGAPPAARALATSGDPLPPSLA